MKPTRAERRATLRTEQEKVVPGSGIKAFFDRGAWSLGGGRAGQWQWWPVIVMFAFGIPLGWFLIGRDTAGLIGPVIGIVAVVGRGYWLHRRYVAGAGR